MITLWSNLRLHLAGITCNNTGINFRKEEEYMYVTVLVECHQQRCLLDLWNLQQTMVVVMGISKV
jgi:hypothetical protein